MAKIRLKALAILLALSAWLVTSNGSSRVALAGLDAVAPALGSAMTFTVLGASTVTNTGLTEVTGEVGVSPGPSVTGFPPGTVTGGTIHQDDGLARQAHADLAPAYNALTSQTCDTDLTGQELGGMSLTPGVYCFDTSAQLTGILDLDAQGDPNAVWVFQIGTTLTTAPNAAVQMSGGGMECRVYWQVGTSATLDIDTAFAGTILADQSVTVNAGTSIIGRALAIGAAVTMDTNEISNAACFGPLAVTVYRFQARVAGAEGSGAALLAALGLLTLSSAAVPPRPPSRPSRLPAARSRVIHSPRRP